MNDEAVQIPSGNGRLPDTGDRISIIAFVNVLLRYRYLIVGVPLVLTALVTALVLRQPVRFTASTRFVPQGFDVNANVSGLAAQFGLRMGGANPSESPAFYAELLHSRQILAEAVLTRYSRADGRTADLMEIFGATTAEPQERLDGAVGGLRDATTVGFSRETSIVTLSVTLPHADVVAPVAMRLVELLNDFNMRRRQAQAKEQRAFLESRLDTARLELRQAENQLERFLERNRRYRESPQLAFEYERLQRQVSLRGQLFGSLAQSFDQARIEEVKNIPVVTVIEPATPPLHPEGRRLSFKAFAAFVAGLTLAITIAFGIELVRRSGREAEGDVQEFARLSREAVDNLRKPMRLLRRPIRS